MDVFSECDSLAEISYGGSLAEWEMISHGRVLTLLKSDGTPSTPHISFMNIAEGTNEV